MIHDTYERSLVWIVLLLIYKYQIKLKCLLFNFNFYFFTTLPQNLFQQEYIKMSFIGTHHGKVSKLF